MNVGTFISGWVDMSDNGVIEKYCYDNREDSCDVYGGLYRWDEMMQYTTAQGAQGICPDGWHPFTFEEWKVLEGAVDSYFGIGDPEWDMNGSRGFDAGLHLRTTYGWHLGENGTDLFGFSALPGGNRFPFGGAFVNAGASGGWWSATESSSTFAWDHSLEYNYSNITRNYLYKSFGRSVRCVKDE